ncbi:MAG: hypothetical protein V3V00_09240 [Saprospiraceae bacterium]
MKTVTFILFAMITQVFVLAQTELSTHINIVTENELSVCANVEVTNHSNEELKILGQNVRLFYNSKKLAFHKAALSEDASTSSYSLEVVTDKRHLSKLGQNQLHFENDLGYINYNVNLDYDYLFDGVVDAHNTITVQSICFTKLSSGTTSEDIVLADEAHTNRYSRAYTQIESTPTHENLLLPATLTDLEYNEELASLND